MFRGYTVDTILMNPYNKMHIKQVLELKKRDIILNLISHFILIKEQCKLSSFLDLNNFKKFVLR